MNLGKSTTVPALGKIWTLGRITVGLIEAFAAWIREREPDPFAAAERFVDKLPREDALKLLDEAKQKADQLASFSLASPLAKKWMNTELGAAKLAQLMLVQHHPEMDEETAFSIFAAIGPEQLAQAIQNGTGHVPNEAAAMGAASPHCPTGTKSTENCSTVALVSSPGKSGN